MESVTVKYQGLEILCKPATIEKYREGKLGFDKVVITDTEIYKNVKKGDRAKAADLQNVFSTTKIRECIEVMLKEGDFPLTADERKQKTEQKYREIINAIHKSVVDPKTKLPHPTVRIESALTQLKFKADYQLSTSRQVAAIMKKLPDILPITRCEDLEIELVIPNKHIGKAQGILKSMLTIKSESFDKNGWIIQANIMPSDLDKLTTTLNGAFRDLYQLNLPNNKPTIQENIDQGKKNKSKKSKKNKGKSKQFK